MKLIYLKNALSYLDLKKENLRNSLISELELNNDVSIDDIQTIITKLDNIYSEELDIKYKISLTNNLNLYRGVLLNKYILNLENILSKIGLYSSILKEVNNRLRKNETSMSENLKSVLDNIKDALNSLEEDMVSLKATIFEFDLNVDVVNQEDENGSPTVEQE